MGKLYIIGTGPGSKNLLTPLARQKIQAADIIIGAPRLLSLYADPEKISMPLKGNYSKMIKYIDQNKAKHTIAVLVSGDPCLFSFGNLLTKAFKASEYEIIPGISSLQLACALLGESWHNMYIMSLHGKSINGLEKHILEHQRIFLFCDDQNTPEYIASYLFKKGIRDKVCLALKNLSFQDEKIIRADIKTLKNMKVEWPGLWVMIIKS